MKRIVLIIIFMISVLTHQASADVVSPELPRGAHVIGTAGSSGFNPSFDQQIKGELDKLLPQLKMLNADATILIEVYCPDKAGVSKEQRNSHAFTLAEQVQQHLKVKHGLDRAFFVALREIGAEKTKFPKVRLTAYPPDFFEN